MMQDIDFTVELKNLSFTHRLSGYFLNRCGINRLRHEVMDSGSIQIAVDYSNLSL